MKPRHILLAGGLAASAWLAVFGNRTPDNDIAEAVARKPVMTVSENIVSEPSVSSSPEIVGDRFVLALLPRETLIGGAGRTERPATLFASHNWTPPPPPPPPAPILAPTAPPLPFKYLGKQLQADEWLVFLSRNDSTFIVKKNDLIENTYKVVDISARSISVIYLPLNQTQSILIE